jgi:hypothetical protein
MARMPRLQFSLFDFAVLIAVSAALAAWWSTGSATVPLQPSTALEISVGIPWPAGRFRSIPVTKGVDRQLIGQRWTSSTIATSLAFVALTWIILLTGEGQQAQKTARITWTLAWLAFLGHAASAFHFHYGWSHAYAAWDTGRRTHEFVGWFWTGGIWINYFFTLLWTADVLYWWSGIERYQRRPARFRWFVHAVFVFMIFQGGAVFASGPIRWATLAGLGIVGVIGLVRMNRTRALILSQ